MAEPQRRILPLPKRRVASAGSQQHKQQNLESSKSSTNAEFSAQSMTPNALFSRLSTLNNEVNAITHALSNRQARSELLDTDALAARGLILESEEEEEEEEDEDDGCTDCRDWLENVKNKKKRKIPTSAIMGHTGVASPVVAAHLSPTRTSKVKSRRRRTWDVTSEARPDAALKRETSGVCCVAMLC